MPIKRKVYLELKAMYDFQRKKEYNKEKLKKAIDMIFENPDVLFEEIWGKMQEPVSYTHLTLPTIYSV